MPYAPVNAGRSPWEQSGMPPEYFDARGPRIGPAGSYNFRNSRGQTFQIPGATPGTPGVRNDYRALSTRPGTGGVDPRPGGGEMSIEPVGGPGGGGPITFEAGEYGPLVDLQRRYTGYLDDFGPATDRGAIRLGQDIRDLGSGMAAERAGGYAARGLRGGGDLATTLETQANVDTTRAAGRAMSDYREGRARSYGEAIRAGLGVAGAPAEMALREKEFAANARMGEANLGLARARNTMDQYLALLNANRSSPIYGEPTTPLTGGGGGGVVPTQYPTTLGVVPTIGTGGGVGGSSTGRSGRRRGGGLG